MQQIPRKILRKKEEHQLLVKRLKTKVAFTISTITLAGMGFSMLATKEVAAANDPTIRASNEQDFIRQIAAHAKQCAADNDLYASVMIAQAILESGWGSSALSASPNHNLFGIKGAYNGQTVYMNTTEFLNGQWVTRNEPFRKYPSYLESFQDNANVLKNTSFSAGKYYYAGAWKSNTRSYRDATAYLTGRYATDPGYAGKLNTIIERYGLTVYDTPSTGGNVSVPETPSTNENNGSSNDETQETLYTVKSGDSFWGISRKFGLALDELLRLNNKTANSMIHPGDKLIVSKSVVSAGTPDAPSQTPNTPTQPQGTAATYTVKAGDTYWGISHRNGLTVDELLSLNHFDKNHIIHPGDKLVVKKGVTPTTPSNNPGAATYVVKKGDTLWNIAKTHGLTLDQLKAINQLKSDLILINQTLKLK